MCMQCEEYKKIEKYNFCPICGSKLKQVVFVPAMDVEREKRLSNAMLKQSGFRGVF